MSKSKIRFPRAGFAVVAVVAIVAWSQLRSSAPENAPKPTTLGAAIVTNRARVAAARASVRNEQPARTFVLPANPPPVGVPSWATRLANQPDQATPMPGDAPRN